MMHVRKNIKLINVHIHALATKLPEWLLGRSFGCTQSGPRRYRVVPKLCFTDPL